MKESVNIAFMLLNLALFGIIVGLNIKSMMESNKGEEGKADYYKHWSLQVSVLTIIVVAFTVAVKTVFNLGTIYQFTLPTTYCIYENIKKDDFQTEIVF